MEVSVKMEAPDEVLLEVRTKMSVRDASFVARACTGSHSSVPSHQFGRALGEAVARAQLAYIGEAEPAKPDEELPI